MRVTSAAEHVARAVGACAAAALVALVLGLRARVEDDVAAEEVTDLLLGVWLVPVVALLCVASLVCLLVAAVRARGRLAVLTWVLALPAALAGAAVVVWAATGASVDVGALLEQGG